MERLYVAPTDVSPEIFFSPHDNIFRINGYSRPENVREIYDPVVHWLSDYMEKLINDNSAYSANHPFTLQLDLEYFNSSTAKFLFDIVMIMKSIKEEGTPVAIYWFYDPEDYDCREAGEDLAILAEIDFTYIEKPK